MRDVTSRSDPDAAITARAREVAEKVDQWDAERGSKA